jgi:predicted TPR repeat methyltransferase
MNAKSITTVLLGKILDFAWPMCRARFKGVISPPTSVARFWELVGGTGEALEALVDRVATRFDIDISTYMIDRAYRA